MAEPLKNLSTITTTDMASLDQDQQVNVSVGTINSMMERAAANYSRSVKDEAFNTADFWHGYKLALRHVLQTGDHV